METKSPKHLFLICKAHGRARFGSVWMDISRFIDMFINVNIKNSECEFTETLCDVCKEENLKNEDFA